jgi:hypothetical protein
MKGFEKMKYIILIIIMLAASQSLYGSKGVVVGDDNRFVGYDALITSNSLVTTVNLPFELAENGIITTNLSYVTEQGSAEYDPGTTQYFYQAESAVGYTVETNGSSVVTNYTTSKLINQAELDSVTDTLIPFTGSTKDVELGGTLSVTNWVYLKGDEADDDSWRLGYENSKLYIQVKDSGTWINSATFTK